MNMKTITLNRIKELNRIKQEPSRVPAKPVQKRRAPATRPTVKHILVPIDFSEHSLHALEYARNLAEQNGGSLTLINVVEPLPGWADAPLAIAPEKLSKEADTRLQRIASERGIDPQLIGRTV